MENKVNKKISTLFVAMILTGCATDPTSQLTSIQNELDAVQEKNNLLQSTIDKTRLIYKELLS